MHQQPTPPEYTPWQNPMEMPPQPVAPVPPQKKRSGVQTLILSVLLILAVALILNASVFRIRNVAVIGNEAYTWEQIVRQAGLEGSVGYFSLNEEKIKANINANRYLTFEGMEKQFPSTLILYIRERTACADMQVMGVTYRLDEDGMVLERDGTVQPSGERVLITGFQAREIKVGKVIVPGISAQMKIYLELMSELQQQQYMDEVSELNITDTESLYLITKDGYTAHLGDGTNLRAKIGTVRGVVAKLREMNRKGGVIEASVPGEATYTPVDL